MAGSPGDQAGASAAACHSHAGRLTLIVRVPSALPVRASSEPSRCHAESGPLFRPNPLYTSVCKARWTSAPGPGCGVRREVSHEPCRTCS